MTELLFEGYQIPSLTYGVDSLFSFYENNGGSMATDGLVFSSGHHTTQIIPIFGGRGRLDLASRYFDNLPSLKPRISYGGIPAADFLLKSLQLKFPSFPVKMSFSQAQVGVPCSTKDLASHAYANLLCRRLPPLLEQNRARGRHGLFQ